MRVIRWLDSAELDLTNIIRYIEVTFGTSTASQVFDDIMLRVEALCQFSYLGTFYPLVQYKGLKVYTLHERHTRVFYSITDSEIIIVLVWNNLKDDSAIVELLSFASQNPL